VNGDVATCALAAGLEPQSSVRHSGLVVKAGVALQAKLAAFAPDQHHAIGIAVRTVAGGATLHFERRVLVNVRPTLLCMTVNATLEIRLVQRRMIYRPVGIVAIAALHQALGHTVMHWLGKLRLHVAMTAKAQLRLGLLKQAAMQPADFIRQLRHFEKVALRRLQIALAQVFDLADEVRGMALIAGHSMGDVS